MVFYKITVYNFTNFISNRFIFRPFAKLYHESIYPIYHNTHYIYYVYWILQPCAFFICRYLKARGLQTSIAKSKIFQCCYSSIKKSTRILTAGIEFASAEKFQDMPENSYLFMTKDILYILCNVLNSPKTKLHYV